MSERQKILTANDVFYRAIRAGEYYTMDALWSHDRRVECTHPGWPLLRGRDSVLESWRQILSERDVPDIWPTDPHVTIIGRTAMVLCTEQIGDVQLMASNGFLFEDRAWCIFSHHAAHIPVERAY
jgi:hypothetical protein